MSRIFVSGMTSETEHEGNVPNPFLNLIGLWQNYLIYWIEVNRNFYENPEPTSNGSNFGTRGLKQETHNKEKRVLFDLEIYGLIRVSWVTKDKRRIEIAEGRAFKIETVDSID